MFVFVFPELMGVTHGCYRDRRAHRICPGIQLESPS